MCGCRGLTCALQGEPSFRLAHLLLLDILRLHGQHLLTGQEQETQQNHSGQGQVLRHVHTDRRVLLGCCFPAVGLCVLQQVCRASSTHRMTAA